MALYLLLEKVTLVRRSGNKYRLYFSRLFDNSSKSTALLGKLFPKEMRVIIFTSWIEEEISMGWVPTENS